MLGQGNDGRQHHGIWSGGHGEWITPKHAGDIANSVARQKSSNTTSSAFIAFESLYD